MDVQDITEANLATLTAQGYTANDLGMLAASEVEALLMVERVDTGDSHEAAAARQDAAAAPVTPAAAAEPAEDETADEGPFIPQYKAEVPADAKEQIAAARNKERESFQRLMDGEIDAEAYQAVKDSTDELVDELRTQALTATIFQQANAQAAEQQAQNDWKRAETTSFAAFKAEGLDYKNNPALLAAYNVHLKALGADEKNERRDSPWFLTEAHRLTKESLGLTTLRKSPQESRSGVDIAELPPTLRGVPVAAMGAVNGDEFAHLRNLTGLEAERAHAALTDAQRDRYMNE